MAGCKRACRPSLFYKKAAASERNRPAQVDTPMKIRKTHIALWLYHAPGILPLTRNWHAASMTP